MEGQNMTRAQDYTLREFMDVVGKLPCENPSDARHRDDLMIDFLKADSLTSDQVRWLMKLVNRGGARFTPPRNRKR